VADAAFVGVNCTGAGMVAKGDPAQGAVGRMVRRAVLRCRACPAPIARIAWTVNRFTLVLALVAGFALVDRTPVSAACRDDSSCIVFDREPTTETVTTADEETPLSYSSERRRKLRETRRPGRNTARAARVRQNARMETVLPRARPHSAPPRLEAAGPRPVAGGGEAATRAGYVDSAFGSIGPAAGADSEASRLVARGVALAGRPGYRVSDTFGHLVAAEPTGVAEDQLRPRPVRSLTFTTPAEVAAPADPPAPATAAAEEEDPQAASLRVAVAAQAPLLSGVATATLAGGAALGLIALVAFAAARRSRAREQGAAPIPPPFRLPRRVAPTVPMRAPPRPAARRKVR
jgi:hypothetical protein